MESEVVRAKAARGRGGCGVVVVRGESEAAGSLRARASPRRRARRGGCSRWDTREARGGRWRARRVAGLRRHRGHAPDASERAGCEPTTRVAVDARVVHEERTRGILSATVGTRGARRDGPAATRRARTMHTRRRDEREPSDARHGARTRASSVWRRGPGILVILRGGPFRRPRTKSLFSKTRASVVVRIQTRRARRRRPRHPASPNAPASDPTNPRDDGAAHDRVVFRCFSASAPLADATNSNQLGKVPPPVRRAEKRPRPTTTRAPPRPLSASPRPAPSPRVPTWFSSPTPRRAPRPGPALQRRRSRVPPQRGCLVVRQPHQPVARWREGPAAKFHVIAGTRASSPSSPAPSSACTASRPSTPRPSHPRASVAPPPPGAESPAGCDCAAPPRDFGDADAVLRVASFPAPSRRDERVAEAETKTKDEGTVTPNLGVLTKGGRLRLLLVSDSDAGSDFDTNPNPNPNASVAFASLGLGSSSLIEGAFAYAFPDVPRGERFARPFVFWRDPRTTRTRTVARTSPRDPRRRVRYASRLATRPPAFASTASSPRTSTRTCTTRRCGSRAGRRGGGHRRRRRKPRGESSPSERRVPRFSLRRDGQGGRRRARRGGVRTRGVRDRRVEGRGRGERVGFARGTARAEGASVRGGGRSSTTDGNGLGAVATAASGRLAAAAGRKGLRLVRGR